MKDDELVDGWVIMYELVRQWLDDPGQPHRRGRALEGIRDRQDMYRIADRAQHDDSDPRVRELQNRAQHRGLRSSM